MSLIQIVTGRVAADATVVKLNDTREGVRFRLLSNESWKDKQTGDWKNGEPEGHNCLRGMSAGQTAKLKEALVKGREVTVTGELVTTKNTDAQGKVFHGTTLEVKEIRFGAKAEPKEGKQS
ncbi:single-stranded DNA-binding protein [Pseudomonas nitritireducens]|uniref:Single-stranded DNA-binding protein n=1 Tax=Pseudomonas nitroreducens TaxID=46680 RepID=A0A7W7KF90_PSENT|nr:single-stranded DNA-binding protein [Pseudomonas nitritireducens]MBB4861435.1 single-stranded DNA-binding protein [Pseudomonas nitritireducens]